ncbi:MAG: S-layer homology domain-containing protein [Acidimicrobiales bacterium]|nr:S-layer homology domain-containing protein [Acidimicrobiales bacterium]
MLTNFRKRTALLLSVAVVCATVSLVPQTASAAAWAPSVTADLPGSLTGYRACPNDSAPAAGFTDTTSTDVDCIKMFGITQGKTATTFDPSASVTREEMALFLSRMYTPTGLAAGTGTFTAFTDITGLAAGTQTAINAIAASGITVGTSAGTYSPASNVTREQMAIFLNRMADLLKDNDVDNNGTATAIAGTVANGGYNYTDIASTSHEGLRAIVRLYDLGVAPGAGIGATYRPNDDITRLEMASMMTGLLNHSSARPAGVSIQTPATNAAGTSLNVAAGSMATQISVRNADFTPQANTIVEVIKHSQSTAATAVAAPAFHAVLGTCTTANVVASGTECVIDAADYVTNALGNKAGPAQTQAASNTLTWVAWTGGDGATYIDGTTVASKAVAALGAAATAVVPATTATLTHTARAGATAYDLSADDDITDATGEYTPFGEAVTLTMTLTGATAAAVVDGYSVTFAESRVDSKGNVAISSTAVITSGGKATYTVAGCADPTPATTAATNLGDWCSSEVTITMAGTGTGAATGTYQPLGYQGTGVATAGLTSGGYNTSWSDAAAVYTTASDALAISQNTAVVSTAGTVIDATATAYDQYGRGMAGKTVTFAVGGADKITATTGADGTAVYSYVACTANGTSAVSTNTAAADMATIAATTPGAAGVKGTTVYCVTAGTDGAYADTNGQTDIQTITWSADPTAGDFTVTCGSATSAAIPGESTAATIQTALRLLSELDAIAVVETSATVLTLTNPIVDGDICTVVVTVTVAHASLTVATNGTETQKGIPNQSVDIIEHDAVANTVVVERLVGATTTMLQFGYDSTDSFSTAAIASGGATEAEFEAALHAEAESANEELTVSYRTAATTTGVSTFVVG